MLCEAIVVTNRSMYPSLLTSAEETPVVTIILSLKRPDPLVTSVKVPFPLFLYKTS